FKGFGPLGNVTSSIEAIKTLSKFISSTIGIMTIVAILWFIFVLVTGAIGIINAGGDKAALETAKKKITTGLIGLVIVIATIFIVSLVGRLIGIPDILNLELLFTLVQK
ncbi:hypothetical protein COY29_05905, partial [Candidatus Woesebacteria bacterium CG_4_10_14_0_2_um_filter_39_14]